MEKIKNVLSHNSRKSTDAAHEGDSSRVNTTAPSGEGSHFAGGKGATGGSNDQHPIYDQFTGRSPPGTASGEPARTSDHPPHFSNTTNVKQSSTPSGNTFEGQTTGSTPSSTLSPTAATSTQRGTLSEGASTASIKSGVMGFPQGHEAHAALGNRHTENVDGTQAQGPAASNITRDRDQSSNLGTDATIGAGAAAVAGTTPQLHHQRDHDNLRASTEQSKTIEPSTERSAGKDFAPTSSPAASQQPFERSFAEPTVTTDTDRSFPLAGGVTSRKHAEDARTSHTSQFQSFGTSEREPGTKDKETGVGDGHGREKLAGAAALATGAGAYSASKRTEHDDREVERERASKGHGALTGVTGGPTTSSDVLRAEHELRSGHHHDRQQDNRNLPVSGGLGAASAASQSQREPTTAPLASSTKQGGQSHSGHNPEALAAATAAAAAYSSVPPSSQEWKHDHLGHGHEYSGDPCGSNDQPNSRMLTDGPHLTDTANRMDPRLHVPGEFPETPAETPQDHRAEAGSYITGPTSRQQEIRPGEPSSTLGSTKAAPATVPRQDASVADPTITRDGNQHHHGRDAAIAGGLGAAGLSTYAATRGDKSEATDTQKGVIAADPNPYSSSKIDPRVNPGAPKVEEQRYDPTVRSEPSPHSANVPTSTSQRETTQPTTHAQEKDSDHHHARNAGIAGAGAATAGGLYYVSQQKDKPDSGPASSTIGPHQSNTANVLDPRVQPDPALQKHHQAESTATDPATHTVGPHKSNVANVVDPRVQPEPEKQKGHTTTGPHQPDTLNRLDPQAESKAQPKDQHHYGRDAAVLGGTGAAGHGAYEAAKGYDEHRSTQPAASLNNQRYDPTAAGAHDPIGQASHPTGQAAHEPAQNKEHHYGRDAAVAGGLGAAGAGAYAATRQQDGSRQPQVAQNHPTSQGFQQHPASQTQQQYAPQVVQQAPVSQHHQALTSQTQDPNASHQRYDSVQDPNNKQHQKRDAATLGAAGAVGAGGAYAYSQHDAEKAEKERLAQEKAQHKAQQKELDHQRKEEQKEIEHKRKEQQKELEHRQKEQNKASKHQQHELEKQQAKDQKKHDKHVVAEEQAHQKELEKERERQQKAAEKEKEEDDGKEKKHHLFGFLHRDKSKKEKDTKSAESSPRHSRDLAAGGATGAGALAAHEAANDSDTSEGRKRRNKLHKDPPPGHPAREALEHGDQSQSHQHVGTDGPIGRSDHVSGDRTHPVKDEQGRVIEPHTGLPMNIEKYGTDGAGGTDGSRTVEGYNSVLHNHGQGSAAGQQGQTTDWEGIRKANTPY